MPMHRKKVCTSYRVLGTGFKIFHVYAKHEATRAAGLVPIHYSGNRFSSCSRPELQSVEIYSTFGENGRQTELKYIDV